MRTFSLIAFFMLAMGFTMNAQAKQCTVNYKKCTIKIWGKCVKSKKRTEVHQARNATAACNIIRRKHGSKIRYCNATCVGRQKALRWVMKTRNGRRLQGFGRGANAKSNCKRALRTRQCRERRNRAASCIGMRNGREVKDTGPTQCRRRRR